MAAPTWVDFETAERSAAVMARGLTGHFEAWGTLLAHAQAVLAGRTDNYQFELPDSYEFSEWQDLVAAARILDLAASDYGVSDLDARKANAVLAACAFGMSGTAVSATAVAESHDLLNSELSPGELTALSISSPVLSRNVLPRLPANSQLRTCIENLVAFLASGNEEHFNTAKRLLQEVTYDETGAWEGYLLRLSRLSLAHAGRLSTARVLRSHDSRFPRGYLDKLVSQSPLLLPSQFDAINKHGVLASNKNLLVTLPTGTGKTLLGELSLLSSLGQEPGLVCYIAPYVALGRQVAEKISLRIPEGVRVHRSVGGYREPVPLEPNKYPEVLIATPERFDAALRLHPELLSMIRCVVFDEAHMLGSGQRGVRLEGILTRLRLAKLRGETTPRFVLLSAVLSNSDALAEWIDIDSANVIKGTWRSSANRLLRWTEDGVLRLHAGDDPLRSTPNEVLGEVRLPWPNKDFYPSRHFGSIRKQEPLALENVALLAGYNYESFKQPVLCVCLSRRKTRILAALTAKRFVQIEPLPNSIKAVTDLIDEEYQYLRPLKYALQRGVAYHNSTLPQDIREGIERAVEAKDIKVVAATTTLAEGVDLPFRVTILADWLTYDGVKNRPMESLLFKNISGRCGRAGQFTEGDTIIFDNPVGDEKLTFPTRRLRLQEEIFFSKIQPVLTSAIPQLDFPVSVATVGSQLLATIAENPHVEDLTSTFRMFSFFHHTGDAELAMKRLDAASQEILDNTRGQPLAIAASPVQLTPFGEAANQGGLSPGTARVLRHTLNEINKRESHQDDLVAIGVTLLESLSGVPEQGSSDLRKAVSNPKSLGVIRPDELDVILRRWLKGESLQDIFRALPSNRRSRRTPRIDEWFEGVSNDSEWNDRFSIFCDFINNTIKFFLPWVLRASRLLATIDGQRARPWREWARYVELGVDSAWGTLLVEEEQIVDRAVAFQVGRQLDNLGLVGELALEQFWQVLIKEVEPNEMDRLLSWFRQREAPI